MKPFISLALAVALTGCATYHHHPVLVKVTGAAAGVAIGASIALATRAGHCAGVYDGHPYSGTPPCPVDTSPGKVKPR